MDFNFCQKCGFRKELIASSRPPKLVDVDADRAKKRLNSLKLYQSSKPYQRQKSSLQNQLETYLWSLPQRKTPVCNDVIGFFVWRDKFGKTVVHTNKCSAQNGLEEQCSCPRVLAAGTVDNNIGKLRTIFRDSGGGLSWNDDLHLGNPTAHPSIKQYHATVLEE